MNFFPVSRSSSYAFDVAIDSEIFAGLCHFGSSVHLKASLRENTGFFPRTYCCGYHGDVLIEAGDAILLGKDDEVVLATGRREHQFLVLKEKKLNFSSSSRAD